MIFIADLGFPPFPRRVDRSNGSTRGPSGHRATREFIARDIPMSGDDAPTWSGDYAPACSRRFTMRVFHPVARFTRIATFRAASTTPRRRASRPSR